MDQLLCLPCVPDIRDFLGKLSKDLKTAYDEIMDQINSQQGRSPEIARRAFLWVMCSRRPLGPRMLADAVCRDPETGAINPAGLDINVVLEACRNLVMIDQSGVCRFSHLSVQEYLETHHYSNGQAHLVVGSACLQILLDPTNWLGIKYLPPYYLNPKEPEEEENILRYAVAHWPDHVRLHGNEGVDDRLRSLVKEFFGSPSEASAAYECWSHRYPPYGEQIEDHALVYSEGFPKSSSPAFAIVLLGLNQILDNWWTSNLDVDQQDDQRRSLFLVTVAANNMVAAEELLALGANPNLQDNYSGNVLQWAAHAGREAAVRLLLDRGAYTNSNNSKNSLWAAASNGSEVIVRLLLDRGADINAQGGEYGNALQAAASNGSKVIVRLLLDRGADINAQGGFYGNALQAAASKGREVIFRLLLDRGADINAQGGLYGNALQAAVSNGSEAIVRLLLDRGADINAQGGHYGNALHAAVSNGSEVIVRLLLDRGADINAQGGYHGNVLRMAVSTGSEVIVRLLLDRGANVNSRYGNYGDLLQAAAERGDRVILRLLLDHGADIETLQDHYRAFYRSLGDLPPAMIAGSIEQGPGAASEGK